MLCIAAIAAIGAVLLWTFRAPLLIAERARPPDFLNPDHDVFDVVLLDLIDNPEFDPATHDGNVVKRAIIMGEITRPGLSYQRLQSMGLDRWFAEKRLPPEVTANLLARNPVKKRFHLADYHPADPSILVRDVSRDYDIMDFGADFRFVRGYAECSLPGYSRDGQTAVICFWWGPTAHGAGGCYILRKSRGCWNVSERWLWTYS
jgi:hypothetical protein